MTKQDFTFERYPEIAVEEVSAAYGDQVDMGTVEGDLSVFDGLGPSYELVVERA